jgi:TolB protein
VITARLSIFILLTIFLTINGCQLFNWGKDYCTEPPPQIVPVGHVEDASFSPDGRKVVFSYHGNPEGTDTVGLYIYDVEKDSIYPLIVRLPTFLAKLSNFSPSGEWIVFVIGSQIWKIKADGDILTQLTFSGRNFFPRWSPDGKKIAFDSNKDAPHGENVIWLMDSGGDNLKRICEWGKGERRIPSFSPDGSKVLHIRWSNEPDIALMDTSGGNVQIILSASYINATDLKYPRFSPDGSKIVFSARKEGEGVMVWVMNADGPNPVPLSAGDMPDWSPNGDKIIYSNKRVGGIWIMDPNGCNKEVLIVEFN